MRSLTGWIWLAGTISTLIMMHVAVGAPPKPTGLKPGIRTLQKIEKDYIALLGSDDPPLKRSMKVDLYLQSGKSFEGVVINDLQPGKQKHSFKIINCTSAKGTKQKVLATTLLHIVGEDRAFDVVQDSSTKSFLLLDLAERDRQAIVRLAKTGHALWEEPSDQVRQETIDDAKSLFQRARELFPDHSFQLQETEFYLFFTDMSAEQIAGYIANLDTMYRQLCIAFGILPNKNIWKGKCPVLAFLNAETFRKFESTVMQNDAQGAQGLHHGMGDGRVVITIYRGNDPAYFAAALVHETAHGFLHRLRSNVHITGWLNEGIADWISGIAVPASNAVPRRQSDGIVFMRAQGSMGGFFDPDKKFTPTDYGIASSLTQFMLDTDPNQYRAFLMAIKDGYSIEESLKLTYECTPAELVHGFGTSIGIANLQP